MLSESIAVHSGALMYRVKLQGSLRRGIIKDKAEMLLNEARNDHMKADRYSSLTHSRGEAICDNMKVHRWLSQARLPVGLPDTYKNKSWCRVQGLVRKPGNIYQIRNTNNF